MASLPREKSTELKVEVPLEAMVEWAVWEEWAEWTA